MTSLSHYERPSQPAVVKKLVGGIVATMIGTAHGEDGPLSAFGKSWVRSRVGRLTGNRRGGARTRKQELMVTEAAVTLPNPMISPLVVGQAVVIHTVRSCGFLSPTSPLWRIPFCRMQFWKTISSD